MQISEKEQSCTDFDWFGLDCEGAIGHFTTAGFKNLPKSVAKSREDLDLLLSYFEDAPFREGHLVDSGVSRQIPEEISRGERYLRSFVAIADKGLYSYDIDSYLREGICYFRVALPVRPLHVSDLPMEVREVLSRTMLSPVRFRDATEIPYATTLLV